MDSSNKEELSFMITLIHIARILIFGLLMYTIASQDHSIEFKFADIIILICLILIGVLTYFRRVLTYKYLKIVREMHIPITNIFIKMSSRSDIIRERISDKRNSFAFKLISIVVLTLTLCFITPRFMMEFGGGVFLLLLFAIIVFHLYQWKDKDAARKRKETEERAFSRRFDEKMGNFTTYHGKRMTEQEKDDLIIERADKNAKRGLIFFGTMAYIIYLLSIHGDKLSNEHIKYISIGIIIVSLTFLALFANESHETKKEYLFE